MTVSTGWIAQGGAVAAWGSGHDFNGQDGVAVLNGADVYGLTDWSIFAEIHPDLIRAGTIFAFAAGTLDQSGGTVSEYLALRVVESGIRLNIQLAIWESDETETVKTSAIQIGRDVYSRICLTAGSGKLYINGVQDPNDFTFSKPVFTGLNRSLIGARIVGGAFSDFFDGKIRDLRLYGAELSAGDVLALETDRLQPGFAISGTPSMVKALTATLRPTITIDAKPKLTIRATGHVELRARVGSYRRMNATIAPRLEAFGFPGFVRQLSATIGPAFTVSGNGQALKFLGATIAPGFTISGGNPSVTRPMSATIRPTISITGKARGNSLITGVTSTGQPSGLNPDSRTHWVEIHDASGDLLDIVTYASGVQHSQRVNEPDEVSFMTPLTEGLSDLLVLGNEVWIRRLRDGRVISVCDIPYKEESRGDGGMPVASVRCVGLLARLNRTVVNAYEPPAEPANTTKRVIQDLLALQTSTDPITLHPGSAFPAGFWSDTFDTFSILQCLQILAATSNFQFRVNEDKQLEFVEAIEPNLADTRRVRYGKNLVALVRRTDSEGLIDKLYAYGAGQGASRIRLSDADGQDEDYILSGNYDPDDPHEGELIRDDLEDPNQLLAAAIAYLAEVDTPKVEFDIVEAEAIGE